MQEHGEGRLLSGMRTGEHGSPQSALSCDRARVLCVVHGIASRKFVCWLVMVAFMVAFMWADRGGRGRRERRGGVPSRVRL